MGQIMKETVAALQCLTNSSWCARRKEPSVTMMAKPSQVIEKQLALGLQNNAHKTRTKRTSTLAHVVAKPLSSKQAQLNPSAKVLLPSKITSDAEKSTTAGSGDLTEDDRFYDSGIDFGVAPMATPDLVPSQPGFAAPPGLEYPGLELPLVLGNPLATRLQTPFLQDKMRQGTQLNSQAKPFVPTFSKKAAPPNAKKISISNELDSCHGLSTNNLGKFIDATLHLQQSLSQLKGALAEWEDTMPGKDEAVPKGAAQVMAHKQTVELMSKISSSLQAVNVPATTSLGNATAGNPMFDGSQQPCNVHVMEPTAVAPHASRFAKVDPALAWKVASLEQQSWQNGYNLLNGPQQSKRLVAPAFCMMPEDPPAGTLRASLQELDKMPAECIFIVRRIYRLGLDSPAILAAHFAAYGVVNKVLVCHSRQKSKSGCRPVRVRAAGLGFVCMSSADGVATILGRGVQHVINGVVITVQPYEARTREAATQEQEVEEGMLEEKMPETEERRFQ